MKHGSKSERVYQTRATIYSIPNKVHGKLLSMGLWNSTSKLEEIDFDAQDFWINFKLRSGLMEKEYVAKMVAEKVGKILTLIGPLNSQGEYNAHVVVDLKKALVHQMKVIIIEGDDKETIKLNIFFMGIPHGTCRSCWHVHEIHSEEICRVRHVEYLKNHPKVFVYGNESKDDVK
ncbi:uncharacterized protein LOC113328814 [Papaver somniferum]|uniref:uncharacterized protein LOC113328814 n=1 Tax=Papaver somniferum TaxID=3469 RepID=UPI000E6FDE45|nr:uncharacterized protein LOC113328814 [Papaver somniferum]